MASQVALLEEMAANGETLNEEMLNYPDQSGRVSERLITSLFHRFTQFVIVVSLLNSANNVPFRVGKYSYSCLPTQHIPSCLIITQTL